VVLYAFHSVLREIVLRRLAPYIRILAALAFLAAGGIHPRRRRSVAAPEARPGKNRRGDSNQQPPATPRRSKPQPLQRRSSEPAAAKGVGSKARRSGESRSGRSRREPRRPSAVRHAQAPVKGAKAAWARKRDRSPNYAPGFLRGYQAADPARALPLSGATLDEYQAHLAVYAIGLHPMTGRQEKLALATAMVSWKWLTGFRLYPPSLGTFRVSASGSGHPCTAVISVVAFVPRPRRATAARARAGGAIRRARNQLLKEAR
jgi:hypothetical protein